MIIDLFKESNYIYVKTINVNYIIIILAISKHYFYLYSLVSLIISIFELKSKQFLFLNFKSFIKKAKGEFTI